MIVHTNTKKIVNKTINYQFYQPLGGEITEEFKAKYQANFRRETEIKCYDQLINEEICVHVIYYEMRYPLNPYIKLSNDEKYIINEAIGRYCRKNNINVDHIFDINVLGELIPKRIKHGYLNVDKIVNSILGTQIEWEVKDFIKEIRSEIIESRKRAERDMYSFDWSRYE